MDYRTLQHELDMAAEELDSKGMKDLADRVDFFNEKARTASPTQRKVIARILRRIDREATSRMEKKAAPMPRRRPVTTRRPSASRMAMARRRMSLRERRNEREAARERVYASHRPEPRRELPRRRMSALERIRARRAMRARFARRSPRR